jgi:hypothetical protein
MASKEGNLERRAAGAGKAVDVNRLGRDKGKKLPEKEDQKKIKQNRDKKEKGRKEQSQYEEKRQKKRAVHLFESP